MPRKAVLAALLVLAACREDAPSPTGLDPVSLTPAAAAAPLSFQHISTGSREACGVAMDDRAYCWGISFTQGGTFVTPHPVPTVLRFQEVRVGFNFSCGLTTDSRIYCWGTNERGQLGDGSTSASSNTPVQVAGARRYRLLRVGRNHACAITMAGLAFCWGDNEFGQLGDGTTTNRRSPRKIAGTLEFLRLGTGHGHTCGVTTAHKAYCWGLNNHGQLGDGTSIRRSRPNPVFGGLAFAQVSAGLIHSCGVTTSHQAYCWGSGASGKLGYGDTDRRGKPVLVAGGIAFSGVTTGNGHSCGTDTNGRAWCWGFNSSGQVGDGTSLNQRLTPVQVAGGLRFDAVLASFNNYTCGIATSGRGYCWGENTFGYLGDGTTENRSAPTAIAPPS